MLKAPALVSAVLAVVVLAAACGGGSAKPSAAKVSFQSDREVDGVAEIYTMAADGTDLVRLASIPQGSEATGVQAYAWSPDGEKVAFTSDLDGNLEIYVMNADGSGQTRLTNDPATDTQPQWSPDGKRIAFLSARDGNAEVYVMNADGSDQTRLTNNPAEDAYGSLLFVANPWSPDGQRLAFNRYSGSADESTFTVEIYVMNADGSNETRLAEAQAIFSAWSPDGTKVLSLAAAEGEGPQVYVMNADGSERTRLTDNLPDDHLAGFPLWSPDGQRIAFAANQDGQDVIYIMKADGSEQTALTTGQCDGLFGMAWSPDGQSLVFARGCDFESVQVWVMGADGTAQALVADSPAFFPAWVPAR